MSLRPILKLPDPKLKLVSAPITKVTDETRALAADMFETMYEAPGIGLAAIQIGEPVRLVVLDVARKDEEPRPMTL
ncbi:MAG: peptide deformylase, partial [Hyphomicrobiales bacterium]|nr:peptide deformylase [Hyphomicrobiales bacterium]